MADHEPFRLFGFPIREVDEAEMLAAMPGLKTFSGPLTFGTWADALPPRHCLACGSDVPYDREMVCTVRSGGQPIGVLCDACGVAMMSGD